MINRMVITGATSGVGLDIAKTFCENGWQVIALARNEENLKALSHSMGENFLYHVVDVSDPEQVISIFEEIKIKSGPIDILVNNAAIFKCQNFLESKVADINTIIDTNLKGTMFCTLEALKNMRASSGRIINIASVAATRGIENQAIYCASKFGMDGFAEALNQEITKQGLSITTICPGGIDTPLWNDTNPYPGEIHKILKPADITAAVQYITSLPSRVILKKLTIFPSNEWH